MPSKRVGRNTETKGICTDANKSFEETETTTSSEICVEVNDSGWRSPCKLKEEVRTIIDIMGPQLSPQFAYNTSSEADNEESIFSNSKLSSFQANNSKKCGYNNDVSEKTDTTTELPSKDDTNISTAADINTTSHNTATIDDLTDSKNFPYVENVCNSNQVICPPPLMPANVCVNSECFCPQVASILHGKGVLPQYYDINGNDTNGRMNMMAQSMSRGCMEPNNNVNKTCSNSLKDPRSSVMNWLKAIMSSKTENGVSCKCNNSEYYKMDIKRSKGDDASPPRRVVFELVDGAAKNAEMSNTNTTCEAPQDYAENLKMKKNVKNERMQTRAEVQFSCRNDRPESRKLKKPVEKTTYVDSGGKSRVDVYYFDHGSFNHYQTTDAPPVVTTEAVADKTELYTTRFWAEIFGTIHIGFSFITSFILQFCRFILYSICRPLTIGLIQLCSDYFLKPLLVTLFNGCLQPIFIFIYNIMGSIRDICDPISEGIGYFLRELAILVRAFRLIEVTNENCRCQADCKCDRKAKRKMVC